MLIFRRSKRMMCQQLGEHKREIKGLDPLDQRTRSFGSFSFFLLSLPPPFFLDRSTGASLISSPLASSSTEANLIKRVPHHPPPIPKCRFAAPCWPSEKKREQNLSTLLIACAVCTTVAAKKPVSGLRSLSLLAIRFGRH